MVIGLFMVQTMVAQNTQKLKFVDFALGDTETYIFQDADENYVYFEGCNAENDFAYELSEEDADAMGNHGDDNAPKVTSLSNGSLLCPVFKGAKVVDTSSHTGL